MMPDVQRSKHLRPEPTEFLPPCDLCGVRLFPIAVSLAAPRKVSAIHIPRAVRNGVFDPQPKAQAFALMTSNLQTPAPSATGQTRPHFRPRDV